MTPQQMRETLRQSLEDRRLSRTEKQALGRILEHIAPDGPTLSLYRSIAFDLAREVPAGAETPLVISWLEDVSRLLVASNIADEEAGGPEVCFSPEGNCAGRIAGLFRSVRKSADLCVFTITDDRISDAIVDAHERGVQLRIVTDNEKLYDAGSDIDRFRGMGIPVRVDLTEYHMHHKFAIFDGRRLLNGSYNWTRGAAEWNEENFVISSDPRLVQPFAGMFEKLWQKFA